MALRFKRLSKEVMLVATLVAIGAVVRAGLGDVALLIPLPFYGVAIKIGLTETLTFTAGFVFGTLSGFMAGAFIIIISDLMIVPGPWTPFIAAIIGLVFGGGGGAVRRFASKNPRPLTLGITAVVLTVTSEFLQNWWMASFYSIPLVPAIVSGIPSLLTALANNTILFMAIGPQIIAIMMGVVGEHQVAIQVAAKESTL
jgi:hypothetical protein